MQKKYAHAFNLIPEFGPQRLNKLSKYFDSLKSAWNSNAFHLARAGLPENVILSLLRNRKTIDPEKQWQQIPPDIQVITITDEKYPRHLKEISSSPFILYVKGNIEILNKPSLAVVGSRKMSAYGKRSCEDLVEQLTQSGLVIVSGLAEGIDTIAHQTCLNNNGKTVAVLGCGVYNNIIFPAQNRVLANKIAGQGAVISEYPPFMKAQRNYFPARNRIISGLSIGTLIIEAAQKSGALITAYKALEQNREVLAVPGSIYNERSDGCNTLIKKGAKLVQTAKDIIEELPLDIEIGFNNNKQAITLTKNEEKILQFISREPININQIMKLCGLQHSSVLSVITSLELKNIIKKNNNNIYKI